MDRVKTAIENHKKGYNCAQAVVCAFADKTEFSEDQLFRMIEGFGGGMGGTGGVCGAVSAMVVMAGLKNSAGIDALPKTNKMDSYKDSANLMKEFEDMNQSVICSRIKGEGLRSCDGCIEDAVKILEKYL